MYPCGKQEPYQCQLDGVYFFESICSQKVQPGSSFFFVVCVDKVEYSKISSSEEIADDTTKKNM